MTEINRSVKTVVKNTGIMLYSEFLCKVFTFIYFIIVARYLGVGDFGTISFALAFAGILQVLTDFGLNQYTVREVSKDKELAHKFLWGTSLVRSLLVVLALVIFLLFMMVYQYPESTQNVLQFIVISAFLGSFINGYYALYQAFENMTLISLGKLLNSVLMLMLTGLLLFGGFGLIWVAAVYVIVNIIVLIYCIIAAKPMRNNINKAFDLKSCYNLLKASIPFGITNFFIIMYFQVDSVMLGIMQGSDSVGVYNAAYRLMAGLLIIPSVVGVVIYPMLSRSYGQLRNSFMLIFEKAIKYLLLIAFPTVIGTQILAEEIIMTIYGESFTQSITVLRLLIWAIIPIYCGYVFGSLLYASNKQNIFAIITAIAAFANIALNYLLIPLISFNGAAISTFLTESLVQVSLFLIIRKEFKHFNLNKMIMPPLLACIPMGAILLVMKSIIQQDLGIFGLVAFISIGMTIYGLGVHYFNGLDEYDKNILHSLQNLANEKYLHRFRGFIKSLLI